MVRFSEALRSKRERPVSYRLKQSKLTSTRCCKCNMNSVRKRKQIWGNNFHSLQTRTREWWRWRNQGNLQLCRTSLLPTFAKSRLSMRNTRDSPSSKWRTTVCSLTIKTEWRIRISQSWSRNAFNVTNLSLNSRRLTLKIIQTRRTTPSPA